MTSRTQLLDMKPVSYRSLALPASSGPHNVALEGVLGGGPKVVFCDKCKFATMDLAAFRNHMMEHLQPKFYCFYCNNVSCSEAELSAHMKEHTSGYPFTCPHCGQGYMRRVFLVKHIERVHSKHSQEVAKPGPASNSYSHGSNNASTAASSVNPSAHRQAVRLTVATVNSPTVRLDKDEHRGKTRDSNTSSAPSGNTEHSFSSNEQVPHNRALTVPLPEEVSIPAGCLVELVEVKTVNGKKELKLRLFSQQDDEPVIKDARNSVPAPVSLVSSSSNHQSSTLKSGGALIRELGAAKTVSLQRAAGVPAVSKPPQVNKDKTSLKRPSQEVINLVSDSTVPNKIPKTSLRPLSERSNGMRVLLPKPAAPPVSPTWVTFARRPKVNLVDVSQKAGEERVSLIPEPSKKALTQKVGDTKSPDQDEIVLVKVVPRENHLRNNNAASAIKNKGVSLDQQRPATAKSQTPAISLCKSNVLNRTIPSATTLHESSLVKTSVLPNSKISNLDSGEGAGDTSEPESFPVISSVFSLSQHLKAPGAFQPLVMALRGMVMDKDNSSDSTTAQGHGKITNGTEEAKRVPTSEVPPPVATKTEPVVVPERLQTVKKEDDVKKENHRAPSNVHIDVKAEKTDRAPSAKSPTDQESVPQTVTTADMCVGTELPRKVEKSEHNIDKFLTVSLRRIQMDLWEKLRSEQTLRTSKCKMRSAEGSSADRGAIYPMPLRKDQRVKKPGPNQPIVVLNHPKPRTSERGTRASDTVSDTGAPGAVPKCQILKMRLSKVMGQKYEVMGCTVGVFP